jgi:hypothetical protein
MTDMRATERLLEFHRERRAIATNWTADAAARDALEQIESALAELRRRCDTLINRSDLQLVIETVHRAHLSLGEHEKRTLSQPDGALGTP